MESVAPPQSLPASFMLTAIEEEARMGALGVPFSVHERCFHYLLPKSALDGTLPPEFAVARFYILSCLYNPLTKTLVQVERTPLKNDAHWESRAREVGRVMIDQHSELSAFF